MHDGFLRVASATPTIQVANCPYNAQQIIAVAKQAAEKTSKCNCISRTMLNRIYMR